MIRRWLKRLFRRRVNWEAPGMPYKKEEYKAPGIIETSVD